MPSAPDYTIQLTDGYRLEFRRLQGNRMELTLLLHKKGTKLLAVKTLDLDDLQPLLILLD